VVARLRVSRPSRLVDRYRKWDVMVGKLTRSVANGQSTEVLVEPGTHTVRVGHRWLGSPVVTFTIANAKTIEFVCRPRPHPVIWLLYGVASLYRRDLFIILDRIPIKRQRPPPGRGEQRAII
jgi:hypothetical protein